MSGKKGSSGRQPYGEYKTHIVRVPIYITRDSAIVDHLKARAFDELLEAISKEGVAVEGKDVKRNPRWYFLKKAILRLQGVLGKHGYKF